MKFFVSRQRYWDGGRNVVEVAVGGLDYANADMLTDKWRWLGEGREFDDPREAAEAAIAVCKQWRLHGCRLAKVAHVATGGMSIAGESVGFKELRQWAEESWERLPKCEQCGEPLPAKSQWWSSEATNYQFVLCSERCAEKSNEEMQKLNAEQ